MKIFTDAKCCDYHRPGHAESPQRVAKTLELLEAQKNSPFEILEPQAVEDLDACLVLAHERAHLASLNQTQDFDEDTPAHKGIELHARRAVTGALNAMDVVLNSSESAFSLLRPPGHHATGSQAMGFCYLNQAATAALKALESGRRVVVFDFDVHHGNGTEAILAGRNDVLYASVHQSPAYPGTGMQSSGNAINFPMAPGSKASVYRDALQRAFDKCLAFGPDLIIVSAGFDAYRGDPLAQENLELEDFVAMASWLRTSGIKNFSILEGGYSEDLPQLILEYTTEIAKDN